MPARRRHRDSSAVAIRVESEPETVTVDDRVTYLGSDSEITALVELIYDHERTRPLVVVSRSAHTGQPRIDVAALLGAIGDAAHVVVLRDRYAASMLTHRVAPGLRVAGGAVRIFMPHATREDDPDRHPVFLTMTEVASHATVRVIRFTLERSGFLQSVTDPGDAPDGSSPDRTVVTDPATVIAGLEADLRAERDRATSAAIESDVLREQMRSLAQQAAASVRLEEALWQAEERAEQAQAETETVRRQMREQATEATALRRQVRTLTEQVQALTQRHLGHGVFEDAVEQFRHEVSLAWLHDLSPADRERWPLRTYWIGPDFIESVETLEGVDRTRIVATVVDVLTGRVWEMRGRAAHQHRVHESGAAPTLVRADGAVAWRCAIQQNTPSARRLLWWECTDNTVELARAAVHDDTVMR